MMSVQFAAGGTTAQPWIIADKLARIGDVMSAKGAM
jgi:hypothetical protein